MSEAGKLLSLYEGDFDSDDMSLLQKRGTNSNPGMITLEQAFDMDKLYQYFSVEIQGTCSMVLRAEGCEFGVWSDSIGVSVHRRYNTIGVKDTDLAGFMAANPSMKSRKDLILSCLTPAGKERYVTMYQRNKRMGRLS